MSNKKSSNKIVKQVLTFVSVITADKTFVGIPYGMNGEDYQEWDFTILSKGGMLTFDQAQVLDVVSATKEDFDNSTVDLPKIGEVTKTARAKEIYLQNVDKIRRCDVIRMIMKECEMTEKGASTYFQNIKKSLAK